MKLKFIGKGGMPHTFTDVEQVSVQPENTSNVFVVQERPDDVIEVSIDGKMIVELDEQGVISVRQ